MVQSANARQSAVLQILFCANKLANESIKSCYEVNLLIIIRTRDLSQYILKKSQHSHEKEWRDIYKVYTLKQ